MESLRVLVADDESIIRLDLRETLRKMGHEVIAEAGDGLRAVEMARQLKPDLVILDIKMPEMDGIDAAKLIAEEKIAPVLLVTAYSQLDLINRARDAGVFGYVVKPFQESDLLPAIQIAIARFQEYMEISQQAKTLEEQLETRKLVDRAKGFLMDTQSLKEQEAFRKIQQLSMNTRKSMREIAQAILLTAQIEK